jgi:hypothetical protein
MAGGSQPDHGPLGDPARCDHVGDREADILELVRSAQESGTHFVVRTCLDRRACGGDTTISRVMEREPVRGGTEVEARDDQGRGSTAELDVRFRRLTVYPTIGNHRRWPTPELTAIDADGLMGLFARSSAAGVSPS